MTSTIYLFPDTNLFIQCKPLNELDWSEWRSFDEVSLFVSRPVQAEIDKQKGNGNSRLSKRARTTSQLFRNILRSKEEYFEVRNADPIVHIYLRQDLKPDESLSDQLSYTERDDQLVGIAALFANNNPDANVQILTHDTGPMTTAKMVGLRFKEIPESWLLPPEADETEKRVNALQNEVTRLKKAEPIVKVRIENAVTDKPALDFELPLYSALDDDQIANLVKRIERHFPPQTDFGSRMPEERHNNFIFTFLSETQVFTPATDEEIAHYQNKHYPAWLQECEKLLCGIHEQLNKDIRWPEVTVWLSNTGSRPAEDVLITLSAKGDFKIQPPPREEAKEPKPELALPYPPLAPQGSWTKKRSHSFLGIYDNPIGHALQRHDYLYPDLISQIKRNPNCFYYQSRPGLPVDMFSLTCAQWRHQDGEETFQLTMHVELKPKTTIEGALEVKVHAANMTDPVLARQPVRITVKEMSVLGKADELVTNLIERTI